MTRSHDHMTFRIPSVRTERLLLRAPNLDDLGAYSAFFETERSHIVGGPKDTRTSHASMMATFGQWALRGHGMWHIACASTDRFLGWVGLLFAPGWEEVELGWTVLPDAEGKGIAFEAATAARKHAAQHLGLDGVISYIAPQNTRSLTLAHRLGATLERNGTLLGHDVQVWRHPTLGAAT